VNDASTPFEQVDDAALEVPFGLGFTFSFYAVTYDSVFLNTNGGLTFGGGFSNWSATMLEGLQLPAIGVFWCDHSAERHGADLRAHQLSYQQCADRFVVRYVMLQSWFHSDQYDSATVTLLQDGTIVMEFGEVLSEEIFTGVFDGTRTDDRHVGLRSRYAYYPNGGTGLTVFDSNDLHSGELSNQTITFHPE
jgi:hypothetical protein